MCPRWYIWEAEGLVKKKVKVKVSGGKRNGRRWIL